MHFQCGRGGDPVVKVLGINYMKRKKANQMMTQNIIKNVLFKGWLVKGQSHFTQLKNICIKKFQRQEGPFKNSLKFSFK